MKVGIFGGTFNPPHNGHLIVAEEVRQKLFLDKIIFIPSYISPHKQAGESELANHRLAMTMLATKENPIFECSEIEINNKETSFTIHTLEKIKEDHPKDQFFLMIGMDNYLTFQLWKQPEDVINLATLAVMNRPGFPKQVNELIGSKNTIFVDVPNIDISSSDIRNRREKGRSIRYLVPRSVEEYILANELFIKNTS